MAKNTEGTEISSSSDEQAKAIQNTHLSILTAALVFGRFDKSDECKLKLTTNLWGLFSAWGTRSGGGSVCFK